MKKPYNEIRIIVLAALVFALVMQAPVRTAPLAKASAVQKARAKYGSAVMKLVGIYAKANQHEKVCRMLGELLFLDPGNEKAGRVREKHARLIASGKTGTEKAPSEKTLAKQTAKVTNAALKNFPRVVAEAVKQRRFSDAAYWIRFTVKTTSLNSTDKPASKGAKAALKKLRRSLKKMSKAKAHLQVLSAAHLLRKPADVKDDEIDKLIKAAKTALKSTLEKRDKEAAEAASGHIKRTAGEMFYWIALPKGFKSDSEKRYPVVVSITGSGAQYEQELLAWSRPYRDRGFIFVSPVATSNTRASMYKKHYPKFSGNAVDFDFKGISKLLEDLEVLFNADREHFYITGLSGGGTFAYFASLRDLGRWRGTAPRNPNFYPQKWPTHCAPMPKGNVYMPVHIFTAENDEYKLTIGGKTPGVEPQTKAACAALCKAKFRCVLRTEVPGVTHNESTKYFKDILDWFDKVAAGTHVCGEPPDYWPKK